MFYRFLQKKYRERKNRGDDDEVESDLESVASDEFEEMLDKMTGSGKDVEDDDLDYMDAVGENLKSSKNKKRKDVDDEGDQNKSDEELDDEDELDINEEDELEMNEEDKGRI